MSELTTFDAAEYLDSAEVIVAYLNEVLAEDDPQALSVALGTIARSYGMTQLARDTGITRDGLYKAVAGGIPRAAAGPDHLVDLSGRDEAPGFRRPRHFIG